MDKNYVSKLRDLLKDKPNHEKFSTVIEIGHDIDFLMQVYPDLIKTFNDLKFKRHGNPYMAEQGAIQATMTLDNGRWISIVGGGSGLYGDGVNSFEMGFELPDGSIDVFGYLTKEGVTHEMIKMQMLPPQ